MSCPALLSRMAECAYPAILSFMRAQALRGRARRRRVPCGAARLGAGAAGPGRAGGRVMIALCDEEGAAQPAA